MAIQGIIFDMDNTLLRSKIDFVSMKQETFQFLAERGILPGQLDLANHTTSTVIEEALRTNRMTEKLIQEMWDIPKKYEKAGMLHADLEPGAIELLQQLQGKYYLVIVTNNSVEAADTALIENDVQHYFDAIVGREMMGFLKPAPDGFQYVLNKFADRAQAGDWISIGDSWIDGVASASAGIPFVSYQGDQGKMNKMGVFPLANFQKLSEFITWLESSQ